ncbi:pseudaminic acid cytidylyltransferase [Psychrobacter sp. JCM 18900]|uniref:pseudaminic acid cytidylyltransferase n=1 Tax=Psychrobacter sp. JCM 18900 TaxID=1298608 RepID=UPI000435343B|nr:pseudaminic acid cytidylyltransferase [Psychrobacter sp. JCM 18900]GAF51731.1 N-acetylneuraminate cytidylyltransferase [Psychrobacter sp. JCM 18900]
MTSIAVIPARGGSKRIPRKNIKNFHGNPLISYSIKAAINSGCFDRIIVSTDDEEIAEVAIRYGAEVPFIRNKELSNDFSGTTPVIQDVIEKLENTNIEYLCCIYATAPMISSNDIITGLNTIKAKLDCDYAFSITSYAFPIQRSLLLQKEGRVSMHNAEMFDVRSQDLEECWHDAGQFYWGTKHAWQEGLPIFSSNSIGIKIPRYRVQDIDTLEDWDMAEILYRAWRQG